MQVFFNQYHNYKEQIPCNQKKALIFVIHFFLLNIVKNTDRGGSFENQTTICINFGEEIILKILPTKKKGKGSLCWAQKKVAATG